MQIWEISFPDEAMTQCHWLSFVYSSPSYFSNNKATWAGY
jgi:hypothetical protein